MKSNLLILGLSLFLFQTTYAQWVPLNSGTSNSLNRVDFVSKNVGYVLPFDGSILRTVDGGATWDSLNSLTLSADLLFDNNISFVNDSVGFITTKQNGDLKLFKTINMGNTWMNISPDSNLWEILKVQFLSEQKGYLYLAHLSNRFWTTNDGGATWTEYPINFGLSSGTNSLPTMFFVNDSTGYLAGGDGTFAYKGRIAKTIDGGQNWSFTILPNSYSVINSIHFPNKDTGYTVSRNGNIFRTIDEGNTWDSINTLSNLTTKSEIYFINSKTGYVISGPNVFKTTDGGNSWLIDHTESGNNLHAIDFTDSAIGFILGTNGTILKSYTISGIVDSNPKKEIVSIYPNPTTGEFNVKIDSFQPIRFVIYNSMGETLTEVILTKQISVVNLSTYSDGIYLYKAMDMSNRIITGKILKH